MNENEVDGSAIVAVLERFPLIVETADSRVWKLYEESDTNYREFIEIRINYV